MQELRSLRSFGKEGGGNWAHQCGGSVACMLQAAEVECVGAHGTAHRVQGSDVDDWADSGCGSSERGRDGDERDCAGRVVTARSDVVLVEQYHGLAANLERLPREAPDFEAWLTPGASVGTRGFLILVRRAILQPQRDAACEDWRASVVRFGQVELGRAGLVDISAGRGLIHITGAHIAPQLDIQQRKALLSRLHGCTQPLASGPMSLLGCFNVTHGMDEDCSEGPRSALRIDAVHVSWSGLAADYIEVL